MEKKITVSGVIQEGFGIGLKNVVPLMLTYLLWIFTIWIPYINVGTTIAISTIPIELSKGNIMNPTFIFGAKYRKFMGEYLILSALMGMGMFAGLLFFFIPAIVISIAWSLSILIFLDKKISPLDAIMKSNEATYGYKWTIFFISCALCLIFSVICYICFRCGDIAPILLIIAAACFSSIQSSCGAVIYRNLVNGAPVPETPDAPVVETPEVAEVVDEIKEAE